MNKVEIINQMYLELEELREQSGISKRKISLDIGKSENWYQQSLNKSIDIPHSDYVLMKEYLIDRLSGIQK